MPSNLRFDQAVVCEGAFYADPIIEHFALKPGYRILIYGASGAIGTAALQLAKDRGAEVVAVAAGRHLGLARSLGADLAVDYTTDAFDQLGRSFDFVIDRKYPLAAIADAYRYVQTGEKAGVVVIDIVTES